MVSVLGIVVRIWGIYFMLAPLGVGPMLKLKLKAETLTLRRLDPPGKVVPLIRGPSAKPNRASLRTKCSQHFGVVSKHYDIPTRVYGPSHLVSFIWSLRPEGLHPTETSSNRTSPKPGRNQHSFAAETSFSQEEPPAGV